MSFPSHKHHTCSVLVEENKIKLFELCWDKAKIFQYTNQFSFSGCKASYREAAKSYINIIIFSSVLRLWGSILHLGNIPDIFKNVGHWGGYPVFYYLLGKTKSYHHLWTTEVKWWLWCMVAALQMMLNTIFFSFISRARMQTLPI